MAELTTLARWNELHRQPRHQLRYPSEHVVRWVAGLRPINRDRGLDIGCGSGRHLHLMRDNGFEVWGIDTSPVYGDSPIYGDYVQQASMSALPFADDLFTIALAWGVFYYGTMGDADQAVQEMHRVLKPGGHGFVSVRTGRDWRADHIDTDGVFRCDGEPEDGMLLDFISEDELQECYGVFGSVSYEISEWTTHDRDRLNSDWLIQVQK